MNKVTLEIPTQELSWSKLSPLQLGKITKAINGDQALINLINQTSVRNYSLQNWTFQNLEKSTDSSVCDTKILLVNRVKMAGLNLARPVTYNRIHVSELGSIILPKGSATLVSQLLPQINNLLSLALSIEDITDAQLPVADSGGNVNILLDFHPWHLQFYSGSRVIANDVVLPTGYLTKQSVGLPNVDDTSDADKPISVPVAQALQGVLVAAQNYARNQIANIPEPEDVFDGGNF